MLRSGGERLRILIDRRVVTELIGWLVHHPDVWQTHAVMFSVNLTSTHCRTNTSIKFVGLCLAKSSLPKAMIGFEIDVATALHSAAELPTSPPPYTDSAVPWCSMTSGCAPSVSICCGCLPCATSNWHRNHGEDAVENQALKAAITAVVQMARSWACTRWQTTLKPPLSRSGSPPRRRLHSSNALSPAIAIESCQAAEAQEHTFFR